MKHNLTEKQKELARALVEVVRGERLPESFSVISSISHSGLLAIPHMKAENLPPNQFPALAGELGQLDALAEAEMLIQRIHYRSWTDVSGGASQNEDRRTCTLTARIYEAVDSNFRGESTGTEAAGSMTLRAGYIPNSAFIMMWMDHAHPELDDVCNTIKDVCSEFSIKAVRADDIEHQERITDVVLEQIRDSEFLIADLTGARPNVYYEVGYAHALRKRPILYRHESTPIHFDLSVHNVPSYKNLTHLKDLLRKRLAALLGRDISSKDI